MIRHEITRCRSELRSIRADSGRTTAPATAVGWSVAAVVWGNGVVLAGRRFGHDQWFSLIGVPLFGAVGAWWLCRRWGFRASTIGLCRPQVNGVPLALTGLNLSVGVVAAISAAIGFATFGVDMRGLRAIRTLVGTAFGEELIHRGVLLALWGSTGVASGWVLVANMVTFGLWHAVGATCDGIHPWKVVGPTAGAVLFLWLRLRFRSIFAPTAAHALNVVGVLKPPAARCPWPF